MRCFCPPDRLLAPCSMARSSSCDCARTKSLICAASSACHSSFSVAFGLAISRLSRNVPAKGGFAPPLWRFPRKGFDGKIVDLVPLRRVVSCVSGLQPHTSFISGRFPESSSTAVDLPDPEPPITARHSPAWTSAETSKRTWWRAVRGPKDLVMEWAERSGTLLVTHANPPWGCGG